MKEKIIEIIEKNTLFLSDSLVSNIADQIIELIDIWNKANGKN